MTRSLFFLFITALSSLLIGCSFEMPTAPKTQKLFQTDAQTASNEVENVWSSNLDGLAGGHHLTVVDDRICLLSDTGFLYTVDPLTGKSERRSVGENIHAGGPCTATRAVAVTAKRELVAYERDSGEASWRVPLDSNTLGSPLLLGGTVVTMLSDGRIIANSLANGELLWEVISDRAPVRFKGLFRPVVVDTNLLLYGTPTGSLVMLNTLDGFIEWSASLASQRNVNPTANWSYIAGPALTAKAACASSFNGKMGCFDNFTGTPLWQIPQSAASPVVSDGRSLFLVDAAGNLQSYTANDGTLEWSKSSVSSKIVPLVHYWDKLVMVDSGEGFVQFHDAASGDILSSNQISGNLIDVVEIDDELIVATTNGVIYRFRRS